MSALKLVLWGFLAVLGSVALAFVVGPVNPNEKVNGLWLVVAAACIYVLAFRFYGRWISRRVVELNDQRVTPAMRLNDGVNFHPTNKYVLFGHHFAAIAGAVAGACGIGGLQVMLNCASWRSWIIRSVNTLASDASVHANSAVSDEALNHPKRLKLSPSLTTRVRHISTSSSWLHSLHA